MLFINLIKEPWHWSVGGIMIAIVMLLLILSGKKFGVSSSFRDICSLTGIGKGIDYFNYDWRKSTWLLIFVLGTIIGGYIASHHLTNGEPVAVVPATKSALAEIGIDSPTTMSDGSGFMPEALFGRERLSDFKFWIFYIIGGLLIGFGTRYAGGCTSGHAITGLSNFQMPSLIAVLGFFAGGLLMTHVLLSHIISWLI